jgi:outer membrane cobalamin receptor
MTLTPFRKPIGPACWAAPMIALLALLTGTTNLWCQSQTPPATSKPVIHAKPEVVEVTTESVPVEASSASVVVLTRSYIDDSHAVSTADLLATVPFLHVAQNGSAGSLTTVSIRGGKPKFTLVLIDGVPVNDITNILGGSVDLSSISTTNIERVEIVSGPLSSIYGSEAVSGVINIISRRDAKPTVELQAEGGGFGSDQGVVTARGGSQKTSYGLSGSYFNIGAQVKSDAFSLGTAAADIRFEPGANKALQAQVRYQHDQDSSFPINGGGPELSILQTPEESHSGAIVFSSSFHHQVMAKWLYGVEAVYFRQGERSNSPAILDKPVPTFRSVPAQIESTHFQRTQVRFFNQFVFNSRFTGNLAAGFSDENGTSEGLLANRIPTHFNLNRPAFKANGEIVYNVSRLTASFGSSVDESSDFGPHPAARAGLNLRLFGGQTTLRGSWASGFQLPSMFALGDPTVGNPALKAETNQGLDAGIEQKFHWLHSRVAMTYFWNSFHNLIDFSPALFKLVNRSSARTQGVELGAGFLPYSKLKIDGDVAYLDWKLENTTDPLRDVPHWEGGLHADWTLTNKLHALINTRWVGRRFDFQVPAPQIDSVGGYANTNVSGVYTVSKRVAVFAAVDNLFNRKYHEFVGFPNRGIYARAGVKYHLFGD